jgi:uncharacterized membrane protein YhaH (DUF805 family)
MPALEGADDLWPAALSPRYADSCQLVSRMGVRPTMGGHVDNIDWKYLLFDFDGRINRAKFWAGIVVTWLISIVIFILIGVAIGINSSFVTIVIGILATAGYVAIIWMGLAISIKRWHDRGKSGWWVLIGLIPFIGAIWAIVETGFLEGTPGDNEYGPNPLLI